MGRSKAIENIMRFSFLFIFYIYYHTFDSWVFLFRLLILNFLLRLVIFQALYSNS